MSIDTLLIDAARVIRREATYYEKAFIIGTRKVEQGARYVWSDDTAYKEYISMLDLARRLDERARSQGAEGGTEVRT